MIDQLTGAGLNIFASRRLENLGAEISGVLQNLDIPLSEYQSLVLVGNGGRTLWPRLSPPLDSALHPFDTYALRQIERLNAEHLRDDRLLMLYPHPRWTIPLQKIGRALNIARPSLLGLDIHPLYGPWFAYRGAFLTAAQIPETTIADFASPCATCAQPCRDACRPSAVTAREFKLAKCVDFRLGEASVCSDSCMARLACPVGTEHRYSLEQIQYHMLRPAHLARLATYGTNSGNGSLEPKRRLP